MEGVVERKARNYSAIRMVLQINGKQVYMECLVIRMALQYNGNQVSGFATWPWSFAEWMCRIMCHLHALCDTSCVMSHEVVRGF